MTVAVHMSKLIAASATPIGPAPQLLSAVAEYAASGPAAPPIIHNAWLSAGSQAAAPPVEAPDRGRSYAVSVATGGSCWPGFTLAALGHALLFAAALVYFGTAGAPQQTSENAIEVEIVLEAPGTPGGPASSAETEPSQPPQVEPSSEPVADIIATEAMPTATTAQEETRPKRELVATSVTQPSEQRPSEEPPPDTPRLVEAEAVPVPPPPTPPPATKSKPRTRVARDAPSKPRPTQTPAARRTAAMQAAGDGGAHGRQAAAGQDARNIDAFKAAVVARLARNKPSTNIAAMAQGVATVTFGIAASGEAQSLRVVRSSGHAVLDQAALQTVRKASPFPPPPPGAPRTFTVPIRFNLR